jgi:hypothetical protein
MNEISNGNLLRSWKEVAAYLGCDARTCHRWEAKYGMPVHRAEAGGMRSPVFAYKTELDSWFRETFRNGHPEPESTIKARPWLKWAIGAGAVLLLAGAYFIFKDKSVRRQPADFKIEGSELVVLDENKRELWRRDTRLADLRPEAFYRKFFQVINKDEDNMLPELIMRDIDGDGDAEVLFAPKTKRDQTGEGTLICYDRRGGERWSFPAGRELRCGGKTYSPDYRISGFLCHDLDGDGKMETIVESFQAPDWPCQLAVLNSDGKLVGEFWNSGYFREIAFHDLDGDGREELIVCGVNNEYRGGCLAVFDTRRISGCSPQTGEFACEGFEPGSMLYYITAPMSDVSATTESYVSGFRNLDVTNNGWIRATYSEGLRFEFDPALRCLQVLASNGFKAKHQNLVLEGRLTGDIDAAYLEMVRASVRYWDGAGWTAEPTMVKR